ncbi:MAG: hypothetical protein DRO67_10435 [Candidatus Asgardarchaeum californiense]|nr:MAG: hypothetical protein DRO67_10435 [Candidatus Asgardarchaeum californiense]
MNEEDKKKFLDDFEKADVAKKLDMWYFALDQGALWEEIIAEMSNTAQMQAMKGGKAVISNE